jgi:deoxyribodipyrimidine photo-lyase
MFPGAAPDSRVPSLRVTRAPGSRHPVGARPRVDGRYVLYWMTAARRTRYNFALERALEHARALGKPLVVLEALRAGYRWASDRLHRFAIDGMADNARRFAGTGVVYHPYVEPTHGAGSGLVERLAEEACVVVADEYPCFFLPRMIAAVGPRIAVPFELIDGNGVLPLRAVPREMGRAFDMRRVLQKQALAHLEHVPLPEPLDALPPTVRGDASVLPPEVAARWPAASPELLAGAPGSLDALPIDHRVPPAPLRGGATSAARVLDTFVRQRLDRYDERNHPDADAASGLSAHLHWGHLSVHEVFARVADHEDWSPEKVSGRVTGQARGFWGMRPAAEAFLDELLTWREVGFNMCHFRPADYDRYDSLPGWARESLRAHEADPRPHLYDLEAFERARTHDPLWNAAQRELLREGRIHNYLRMLWGKKVLEWTRSGPEALAILEELNNKYALDGRDPNSYSGIFWVMGRYDRPWPERAIYGVVRSMSSDRTRKKVRLDAYLARYGAEEGRATSAGGDSAGERVTGNLPRGRQLALASPEAGER